MADTKITNAKPKSFSKFSVVVTTFNGNKIDLTNHVAELSVFESIFDYFMHGEMTLIDNSAIMGRIGFIGQEKVSIRFTRDDYEINENFYVTDIFKGSQRSEGLGTFSVSLTAEKQLLSARQVFSRSYNGLNTEIISKIHTDFLKEELAEVSSGGTSHKVVFPFMKPFQAINMIQKNTYAVDRTPLFLFDTLHDNQTRLVSMGDLLKQDTFMKLSQKNQVNDDVETGQGERYSEEYRGTMFNARVEDSFDTLNLFSKGAFSATANRVDISRKSIDSFEFDYKKHGKNINDNDYLYKDFKFDNKSLNEYRRPKNYVLYQNAYGFESLSNLNTKDPYSVMAFNAYLKRLKTSTVSCYVDSVGGLGCGKIVDIDMKVFAPAVSPDADMKDYINSGRYLVSGVRHFIKKKEYKMSLELLREGIGEGVVFE